ncbi:acyl-CoA thioesterase II [Nocardioides bigeumensis]|uniref:Acyl-CoA thioesterase II n=1 Tax=Nocardioides bigeumensis TaxID=433657 RepID=A0ABP5JPC4_9ACTN
MPSSADQLIELLDLEQIDVDLFRGRQPQTDRQRVFGGQVAAQALLAAIRSIDPAYIVHSLHSYFLRPGDHSVPIVYDVERLRDGRSFATRRIVARQHGRPIYFQTANFQTEEDGLEHADAMPRVAPPEQAIDLIDVIRQRSETEADAFAREWAALEMRYLGVSGLGLPVDPERPAEARLWARVNGPLGDDPTQHVAAFTYASDLTLLGAALVPHGMNLGSPHLQPASLDHTIWFHRPFRADEWWLYDQWSPTAVGGRGLALARVFSQDGRLVATVAQEGLIRVLPES